MQGWGLQGSSVVLPGSVGDSRGDSRVTAEGTAGLCVCLVQGHRCAALLGHLRVLCQGSPCSAQGSTGALPEPARLGKLSHLFQPGHEHLSIRVHPEVLSWMHLAARLERIFTGAESSL